MDRHGAQRDRRDKRSNGEIGSMRGIIRNSTSFQNPSKMPFGKLCVVTCQTVSGSQDQNRRLHDLKNKANTLTCVSHALAVQERLKDFYVPEITSIRHEGEFVEAPRPVEWFPDQLAWYMTVPKMVIRRFPPFASFQKFLVAETDVGNISRQEVVSMIPPLLMDIKPEMTILDLCAAPGSKSAQLIEMIHVGEEDRTKRIADEVRQGYDIPNGTGWEDDGRATGLLIANDVDYKRAHMLVHQMKRLSSPNIIVTNHDATVFPSIKLPPLRGPDGAAIVNRYLKFDRILADVPCTGDGTARKNTEIWRTWTPQNALGLHLTQIRILVRALQMLKVGGRVVYSTCSMNPVEDEAVVANAIDRCGGLSKVEIINCSDGLPGLKRFPGLRRWKVMDRQGRMWNTFHDVDGYRKSEGITGLGRLNESMFPPEGEMAGISLDRCMRIYPHSQDTGAFFIAVLEKKSEIRALRQDNDYRKVETTEVSMQKAQNGISTLGSFEADHPTMNSPIRDSQAPIERSLLLVANEFTVGKESLVDTNISEWEEPPIPRPVEDGNSIREGALDEKVSVEVYPRLQSGLKRKAETDLDEHEPSKQIRLLDSSNPDDESIPESAQYDSSKGIGFEADNDVNAQIPPRQLDIVKENLEIAPTTINESSKRAEGDENDATSFSRADGQKGSAKGKQKNKQPFEEPFKYLHPEMEELESIRQFYDISRKFPQDRFMVRNALGTASKNIYYTTSLVKCILQENEGTGMKFIHAGVKMFVKQDVPRPEICPWRIQTDGIPIIEAWVGEHRVVRLRKRNTLRKLLVEMFPSFAGDDWQQLGEVGEQVRDLPQGCCILRVEPGQGDDDIRYVTAQLCFGNTLTHLSESMVFPLWKSIKSLNLMLPKEDRKALLLRLFNDSTPLVNQNLEKQREKRKAPTTALSAPPEVNKIDGMDAAAEETGDIYTGNLLDTIESELHKPTNNETSEAAQAEVDVAFEPAPFAEEGTDIDPFGFVST